MKSQINYYLTLKVSSNASDAEIKQAFLNLAKRYHPDKNTGNPLAEKKFKQINLAYQFLKDPQQRKVLDANLIEHQQKINQNKQEHLEQQFQKKLQKQLNEKLSSVQQAGNNAEATSSQIKNWFSRSSRTEEPIDMEISLPLTLKELCSQSVKTVRYVRPHAGMRKQASFTLQVPSGIKNGIKLKFKNKGGANGKKEFGDLLVKIEIQAHPLFKINQQDVHLHLPISFMDSFLGRSIKVPSLYGMIELIITPQTKNKHLYRLRNLGLPKKDKVKGDMFIEILVDWPQGEKIKIENEMKQLSLKQKTLYIQKQNFRAEDFLQISQFQKKLLSLA